MARRRSGVAVLIALVLLVFAIRFGLEFLFPELQERFGETNTVAGVIALFGVAIGWKLLSRSSGKAESD